MGHQTIELYDRLNHLIDYVRNHSESQRPDLMLGLYVCEGISIIIPIYDNLYRKLKQRKSI